GTAGGVAGVWGARPKHSQHRGHRRSTWGPRTWDITGVMSGGTAPSFRSAGSVAARDRGAVVPAPLRVLGRPERPPGGADRAPAAHRAVPRHADPTRERSHARAHATPRAAAVVPSQRRLAARSAPGSRGPPHLP